MPKIIISGRGGSGKSTLVTLLAKKLGEEGRVMVVDADESNLGLASMLGIEPPEQTIMGYLGGKRAVGKKLLESLQSGGNEKVRLFEEGINIDELPPEIMSVAGPVSLVRTGKIEHAMEGCACPMGATTRAFVNYLSVDERSWVIVDTEAGVEHFGRGVLEGADMVLMVVDPSHEAVLLAEKAETLSNEAGKPFGVVINKVDERSQPVMEDMLSAKNLHVLGTVPHSEDIASANMTGRSLETATTGNGLEPILIAMRSNARS